MYISCDIETTGIDPEIIQFGAVMDDLKSPIAELPKFEYFVRIIFFHLVMNKGIMEKIHKGVILVI